MTVVAQSNQPILNLEGRTLQWLANASTGAGQTALLENVIVSQGAIPPHHHTVEELLVCLEGQGEVVLDGVTHHFVRGDTAIVPPRMTHSVHNTGAQPMRMLGFFPTAQPETTWESK